MMTRTKLQMCRLASVLAVAGCTSTGRPDQIQFGVGGAGTGANSPATAGSTATTAGRDASVTTTGGSAGALVSNPSAAGAGQSMTTGGNGNAGTAGTGMGGAGTNGAAGMATAGMVANAAGAPATSNAGSAATTTPGDCSSLPPATDYAAKGPFADAKMITKVGPNSNYTLFRPDTSLGKDGFKHPIATWGNGITTTPSQYTSLLTTIASHGFVVIAANDTMSERPALSAGLDWLIEQNKSGDMQGKLDVSKELAIGYSWGGGAAIDTSNRPNIVATVSFHGMPPRETNAFTDMHSPLLLFTSTGDTFVTASGYVTPNYNKSVVQTFYATLENASFGHTSIIPDAGPERGPAIAWLRFWACGDENARKFFYGDDCTLCKSPFTMPQRKNWK
jgi:hypothetical protein